MTNCLHYALLDAMKLVIEGMALEKEGLDGISLKVVKGPMWKYGPGPQQP